MCEKCNDTGIVIIECEECDGAGEHCPICKAHPENCDCENPEWWECKSCNGTGECEEECECSN